MDPFILLRGEIQGNLTVLHAHLETLSAITPEKEKWKATFAEATRLHHRCTEDVDAMGKAVQIMMAQPQRFQLSSDEREYRRQLWQGLQSTLRDMNATIQHYESMNASVGTHTQRSDTVVPARRTTVRPSIASPSPQPCDEDADPRDTNDFLRQEMKRQQQAYQQQEMDMEDMVQGVRRVRFLADNVNTALEEDKIALRELETETNTVMARLARTNAQIDKALEKASLKSKFICLGVLLLALVILLVLVFTF